MGPPIVAAALSFPLSQPCRLPRLRDVVDRVGGAQAGRRRHRAIPTPMGRPTATQRHAVAIGAGGGSAIEPVPGATVAVADADVAPMSMP